MKSGPALGEPWNTAVSYVDGRQFARFHSNGETERDKLCASWEKQAGTQYWEKENEMVRHNALVFRKTLQTVPDYYNPSHSGE